MAYFGGKLNVRFPHSVLFCNGVLIPERKTNDHTLHMPFLAGKLIYPAIRYL